MVGAGLEPCTGALDSPHLLGRQPQEWLHAALSTSRSGLMAEPGVPTCCEWYLALGAIEDLGSRGQGPLSRWPQSRPFGAGAVTAGVLGGTSGPQSRLPFPPRQEAGPGYGGWSQAPGHPAVLASSLSEPYPAKEHADHKAKGVPCYQLPLPAGHP